MVFSYLSLATGILLGVCGQIALKSGAIGTTSLITQFLNPLTIGGLGLYACAAIAYVIALNKISVSIAFPSVASSYAIVAIAAHFLWREPLGWPQFGGIALIGGGVILLHQT